MKQLRRGWIRFYKKNRHFVWCLYFLVYMAGFSLLEAANNRPFHIIHIPLDDQIPFCEFFVIPYLLWFFYVAWAVLYFGFHDKGEYYRLIIVLFVGMSIFLLVSAVYPNMQQLRPASFARENFCTRLVAAIYASDTPTNLFPSIHVYNSVVIFLAVWESRSFSHRALSRTVSAVLSASIVLSTVFLKQHSLFDVATALVLSAAMYVLVYKISYENPAQKRACRPASRFR